MAICIFVRYITLCFNHSTIFQQGAVNPDLLEAYQLQKRLEQKLAEIKGLRSIANQLKKESLTISSQISKSRQILENVRSDCEKVMQDLEVDEYLDRVTWTMIDYHSQLRLVAVPYQNAEKNEITALRNKFAQLISKKKPANKSYSDSFIRKETTV